MVWKTPLTGGFTIPGESGYEELTLSLAKKWGADVVRDSDGSSLSEELLEAGYGVYSTICPIRGHNAFARKHPETLQQTFLMTDPVTATGETLVIRLLKGYFTEQFLVNDAPEAMRYWQVWDRTAERLVPADCWDYLPAGQGAAGEEETAAGHPAAGKESAAGDRMAAGMEASVALRGMTPWHEYTVSFLAYRIWEEISMYNHVTNDWGEREHLMPIDPMYEEVQDYLLRWMEDWCAANPKTTVVRFTSMFYNFVWIWGESERRRNRFTDWGSYDFTVSVRALEKFERRYGYAMEAEDFIHQGKLHVTHMPADQKKRDWMEFICDVTIRLGKQLVEIVHRHGKQAYLFYDDSWIGTEPYGECFGEMGFDGIIKCVFSGYEVRLCAGVAVKTHEIRLHPYLFPVGLNNAPTFMEGGNPARDALNYWTQVRRALFYAPIQRIGLGGYLHLTEKFPDFTDTIAAIAGEFREIRALLAEGEPLKYKTKVAVLHAWGGLRPWTLSGHFHETDMHDLIHISEALSGLPFDVAFLDFSEAKTVDLFRYQVIINAGRAGSAWSGGSAWEDDALAARLTEWAYGGGVFLGVNEPSAVPGYHRYFRMSQVLGVDLDTGDRVCHGAWPIEHRDAAEDRAASLDAMAAVHGLAAERDRTGEGRLEAMQKLSKSMRLPEKQHMYLTEETTAVLAEENGILSASVHPFGKGMGIWLAGFTYTPQNARALEELLLLAAGEPQGSLPVTDNPATGCVYYPKSGTLAVCNHTLAPQKTTVRFGGQVVRTEEIGAGECVFAAKASI